MNWPVPAWPQEGPTVRGFLDLAQYADPQLPVGDRRSGTARADPRNCGWRGSFTAGCDCLSRRACVRRHSRAGHCFTESSN